MGLFGDSKRALGIDMGTASIKLVELSLDGLKLKLETYGEVWGTRGSQDENTPIFSLSDEELGAMLGELIRATRAKPRNATMSVPIFSSFVTLIELPELKEKELAEAMPFQARKYVPVPIEDVTLDWSIAGRRNTQAGSMLDVLLVAIPNEIVARYLKIAKLAGIELKALESESFGLARSLIGTDKNAVCLADVGASSTDIIIVDEGTVRLSHNFDIAGLRLTGALAQSLHVSFSRADNIKQERGLNPKQGEQGITEVVIPLVDLIINEINRFVSDYMAKTGRKVSKLILSGGSARLPGFGNYFSEKLGMPVVLANPFASLVYPKTIENKLNTIGPSYAVTIGTALRYFNQ